MSRPWVSCHGLQNTGTYISPSDSEKTKKNGKSLCNWSHFNCSLPKQQHEHNKSVYAFWMHLAQLSHQTLYAPLSSSIISYISTCCLSCVVLAFQRSAMKPYTCAIMTLESLGDGFTCVMWNSAHVWRGKSTVKESTTQVRRAISFCCCSIYLLFMLSDLLLLRAMRTISDKGSYNDLNVMHFVRHLDWYLLSQLRMSYMSVILQKRVYSKFLFFSDW